MTKEVKLFWGKEGGVPALNIQYILHADIASMSFSFRCPTEKWHYWLITGIDYHYDNPLYEGQTMMPECDLRPSNKCYCDSTSLGAEKLWEKFVECNCNVEVIWTELEERMKDNFPQAK